MNDATRATTIAVHRGFTGERRGRDLLQLAWGRIEEKLLLFRCSHWSYWPANPTSLIFAKSSVDLRVFARPLSAYVTPLCAVSKHTNYSAKAYRIANRDECQIVAATLAIKVLILVFGIHVFNALEPAAPSRGIGLEVWNRWDSPAYLNIAQQGYTASLPNRAQLVLFPLYPLCMRAVAIVARNYLVSAFSRKIVSMR